MQSDRELMQQALENCRLLAAQHRQEEWAQHILRFCEQAGVTANPLRERLAQPEQEPVGWQSIDTAPKTGKKVILFYLNQNKLPRRVMARWLTDEQAAEKDWDEVGLEGGWYECIDNWDDYTEVAIHEGEPSHWMPLPADPHTTPPANTIANSEAIPEQISQPKQELVARVAGYYAGRCVIEPLNRAMVMPDGMALYTTPPRREWVGLTKEEAKEISLANRPYVIDMVAALEARLKEKNNAN